MWADVNITSFKIEFKRARALKNDISLKHCLTSQDVNYLFRVYTVFYNNCFVVIVFNRVSCVVIY
jgi:hypothetical protein